MRRCLRGGHSGDREPDDLPVESGLSDAELCDAWSASYEALRRAGSPSAHLLIVEKRQRRLHQRSARAAVMPYPSACGPESRRTRPAAMQHPPTARMTGR